MESEADEILLDASSLKGAVQAVVTRAQADFSCCFSEAANGTLRLAASYRYQLAGAFPVMHPITITTPLEWACWNERALQADLADTIGAWVVGSGLPVGELVFECLCSSASAEIHVRRLYAIPFEAAWAHDRRAR